MMKRIRIYPEGAETMKRLAALMLVAAFAAPAAIADDKHHTGDLADGEIRKVDKDAKKITIKHGPLQNIDMPAMTMVFQVKDSGVLDQLKAGDRVKFRAEKIAGAYTVTKIEPVK
jgi:Cu/Ag efflux protein CusF